MTERVKRLIGLAPRQTGNKLIINCEKLERRVALIENGILEEYSIERQTDRNIVGSIFKGRVRNIEHALKAMFVDIGFEKNAFLHFWDALPAALDSGVEQVERAGGRKKQERITAKDIPNIYPVGSEVLVQVTKGPISTKGPRITTNLSLPGRYLVLMPYSDQCGISRKIESPKERDRLRKILKELDLPEGMGLIVRTVGEGQRERYFVRDLGLLIEQWRAIEEAMKAKPAPACVFEEPDLIERTVRDFLTDEIDEVICDDENAVKRMIEVVGQISRRSASRIKHYSGPLPVFENFSVQKQIDDAFHRQVWLPCGGYIVIDQTEALIAIDVNTGRNKGAGNVDKVILQTNLEAAAEVARQLRLRNMGGLVIVDFIDMKGRKEQQAVFKAMLDHTRRDKAKTQILPISQFGLMEMTRQRLHESLSDAMYEPCPQCKGHGQIKTPLTMSVELQRRLNSVLLRLPENERDVLVVIHPDVMQRLRTSDDKILVDLERKYLARLTFRTDPTFNREQVYLANAKTNEEIKL